MSESVSPSIRTPDQRLRVFVSSPLQEVAESLLKACPQLHILARSREALGVAGQLAFRVPSLCTPNVHHLPALAALAHFDAVKLFGNPAIDRAPAAQCPGIDQRGVVRPQHILCDSSAVEVTATDLIWHMALPVIIR